MSREFKVQWDDGDGMAIRRVWTDEYGDKYVSWEGEVTFPRGFPGGVQATVDPGSYVLVNFQGQIVQEFTAYDESSITISKNEPTYSTPRLQPQQPPRRGDRMLPDGSPHWQAIQNVCQCNACTTARGAMMDRDQVARVAADIGSSLMPDNSQWVNRFTVASSSSPSRAYTVAQRRTDQVWGCSCPSWINRRHCKHLTDILARLAKVSAFDVTDPAVLEMLRSARTAYLDLDATPVAQVRASIPTYRRQIDL